MNKLDINRINEYASYKVEVEDNDYISCGGLTLTGSRQNTTRARK